MASTIHGCLFKRVVLSLNKGHNSDIFFAIPSKINQVIKSLISLPVALRFSASMVYATDEAPRGAGVLGRRAVYFQGAGEHWQVF